MSEKEKSTAPAKVVKGKIELTDEQRATMRAAARAKAEKQLAAEAMKAEEKRLFEEELEAARREAGMMTGTEDDELVNVLIDLPEPEVTSCLIINFRTYYHGYTYTVPRHVARSMAEMMFRQKFYQQHAIDGKKLKEFYRRPHNTVLNGSTGDVAGMPGRIG